MFAHGCIEQELTMSNYPPGVSGNEPEITGEWPCPLCGGYRPEVEDCSTCKSTGILPEENIWGGDVLQAVTKLFADNGWGNVNVDEKDGWLIFWTDLKDVGGGYLRVED
jgi:hypothetical protein